MSSSTSADGSSARNPRGQGLTEYIVIVVLVALAVFVGVRYFSSSVKDELSEAAGDIDAAGGKSQRSAADIQEGEAEARIGPEDEVDRAGPKLPGGGREASGTRKGDSYSKDVARYGKAVGDRGEGELEAVENIHFDYATTAVLGAVVVILGLFVLFRKKQKKRQKKFRILPRKPVELLDDQSGQVLVIGAFFVLALMMVAISVANVGMMVSEKIHLQDTVDASAYSAAVVEARFMNLNAYLNRAMVANYDSMAFNTALWSTVAAHDHSSALVAAVLYEVTVLVEAISLGLATSIAMDIDRVADGVRDYLHSPMHTLNKQLDDWFAQDEGKRDLNQYIETFNIDVLSMYAGLLYAGQQSARHEIIRQVAAKMDPEVITTTTLGLGAEAISYDELARAVDYLVAAPQHRSGIAATLSGTFNDMSGTDEDNDNLPYFLGAVTEASLDEFTAGHRRDGVSNTLRTFNLGDLIGDIVYPLEVALDVLCEIATLSIADCDAEIVLDLGAVVRDGQEDNSRQAHVPFIATRRMREVNAWTVALHLDGIPGSFMLNWLLGQQGYTSGDRRNDIGNAANVTMSLDKGFDPIRFAEGLLAGSETTDPLQIPKRGLNVLNMQMASMMAVLLPVFCDEHWDGIFDAKPVNFAEIFPPGPGQVAAIEYLAQVVAAGKTEEGVPNYDWKADLDDVGFYNYWYPTTGAETRPAGSDGLTNNLLTGPSVAVVGVKPWNKVNGIYGLGIGNDYDMTAISRAQVYYIRNPKRPDEVPSTFNPYWAARLAPLDSEDTPVLLGQGLPYTASIGLTQTPTR